VVESQPSKLKSDSATESHSDSALAGRDVVRVWPRGRAVAFQATHTGSIPVTRSIPSRDCLPSAGTKFIRATLRRELVGPIQSVVLFARRFHSLMCMTTSRSPLLRGFSNIGFSDHAFAAGRSRSFRL
jgi:hypothetical protein